MNKAMVKRTHFFPLEMLNELAEYARITGISSADVIRMSVREYLNRHNKH